ncbi:unnamed protein product, partial [Nesidiocoris tenuis]
MNGFIEYCYTLNVTSLLEKGLCPPWPPIATLQPPSTKAVMTQLPWNEPWSIREEENVKLLQ